MADAMKEFLPPPSNLKMSIIFTISTWWYTENTMNIACREHLNSQLQNLYSVE
jgi:hypothetical protein